MNHLAKSVLCFCLLVPSLFLPAVAEETALTERGNEPRKVGPLFTHVLLDNVLHHHVRDGRFDYMSAETDGDLNKYIASLELAQPEEFLSEEQHIAFWINAFNACVLKGIVDKYPVKSVKRIPGFWSTKRFNIAGEVYSLNGIESHIKKLFRFPHIVFALCRGSADGPTIPESAYQTYDVVDRLEKMTIDSVNDSHYVRVDKMGNRVFLSQLFRWWEDEFEKESGGVGQFLISYMKSKQQVDAKYIMHNPSYSLKYLQWNWKLNDTPR
ncbi:MAG: hypothetical protein AUJ92_06380 [Armatimonadetes bacterium CG2_30_59_28]|nr:DUF547 domain-containing protein [Armatimonadota bacterium]OIO96301.1 MAG: hypothetical protein AUJ92_06380 [Armatimonadetes bacterium CG2_30_59_28]PIU60321.1 MAG: hypothetical protein COS85_25015 [Armatimonadetes bacterium CG07_land_8_20_14_0_80_59_28]PIX39673.1 MAG: hypothetical protein COZ56_16770 [Armatimonadetes bacterium CG_4_8_14_3_um_filter_58_9]PIY41678.1 MAG: hypothetical protein COZ05_15350 [Armatimonadetes bacterium CG_4_10_14_3_um_filter_59_10]PJB75544.1 MAG: hypothetical prote